MATLFLIAILLCLACVFGFVNCGVLHLPTHIDLMLVALVAGPLVLLIDLIFPGLNLRPAAGLTTEIRIVRHQFVGSI